MNLRSFLLALTLCLCLVPVTHAEEMQPGQWEYRMETVTSQGAEPAHSHKECISAEDIAEGRHLLSKSASSGACTTSNLKSGDGAFSYDVSCKDATSKLVGKAGGRYTAKTFEMESSFRFDPPIDGMSEMQTKIQGKRTGECEAETDDPPKTEGPSNQ